jgi:hypothetical protein
MEQEHSKYPKLVGTMAMSLVSGILDPYIVGFVDRSFCSNFFCLVSVIRNVAGCIAGVEEGFHKRVILISFSNTVALGAA